MRSTALAARDAHVSIPSGMAGTRATFDLMKQFALAGATDPLVRERAIAILRAAHVAPHDHAKELEAIYRWVRDSIHFVNDARGHETLQTARRTLQWGAGDCDDYAILLVALLRSIGHPASFKFRAIQADRSRPQRYSHVYVVATVNGRELPMDAIYRGTPLGWQHPAGRARGRNPVTYIQGARDDFSGMGFSLKLPKALRKLTIKQAVRVVGKAAMIVAPFALPGAGHVLTHVVGRLPGVARVIRGASSVARVARRLPGVTTAARAVTGARRLTSRLPGARTIGRATHALRRVGQGGPQDRVGQAVARLQRGGALRRGLMPSQGSLVRKLGSTIAQRRATEIARRILPTTMPAAPLEPAGPGQVITRNGTVLSAPSSEPRPMQPSNGGPPAQPAGVAPGAMPETAPETGTPTPPQPAGINPWLMAGGLAAAVLVAIQFAPKKRRAA